MESLTPQIIALGLGMILSPGLFAGTVFLLSSKIKPLLKSFAFLLGNVFTLGVLLFIGYSVGTFVNGGGNGSPTISYFDLGFGVLLLFFAYKAWRYDSDDSRKIRKEEKVPKLWLLFGIGFLVSITNFDAETLYLISMNEIFESGSAVIKDVLLVLYSSIMILLPILLPVFLYILFPDSSKKALEKINIFLKRYGRIMVVILFVLLGMWFLYKGIFLI